MEVAAANSLFLNSFERWVAASVTCSQKGSSVEKRARSIRKSYKVAIKANIEYHTKISRFNEDADSVGCTSNGSGIQGAHIHLVAALRMTHPRAENNYCTR